MCEIWALLKTDKDQGEPWTTYCNAVVLQAASYVSLVHLSITYDQAH